MRIDKIKIYKLPLILIIVITSLRYGLILFGEDEYHIVITLANFALIFTFLFYATKLLIKHKKIILVNFTILLLLMFLGELACFFVLGMPKHVSKSYDVPEFEDDHIGKHLGHVPWADSVWHDVKIVDDKTVFDTYYTIDKINRRVTPGYNENKEKYAVFFGCSICFGYGLKDDQTIPYYVQQKTASYNSYNYSYSGWGCHHMLARMEHKDISKEVKEKEGIGVYIFLWSHIRRAIGDMKIYTGWGHTMPYYFLDGNKIVRDGNFKTGRPILSKFYEYLRYSYIVNYFKLNFPLSTTEDHMILAAEIIKKAKQKYTEQFGNDNFYVVIHPTDWAEFTPEKNEQFKKILKGRGIDYLDYSQKIILDNEHIIVGDGHPNEVSNQKFAKMLAEDLNLN